MSCLYILQINSLLVASFANTLSHSVDCLFILFMVSFPVQKLFSLIASLCFCFYFHYSRRWKQKHIATVNIKECSAVFSCKCFIMYSLTPRSLIHFEVIFVYYVRECSNFILLQVAAQFSKHHLLKLFPFSIVYSYHL